MNKKILIGSIIVVVIIILTLVCGLAIIGCKKEQKQPEGRTESTAQPAEEAMTGNMVITGTGLNYLDIVVGDGEEAVTGKTAVVHYTGWLEDGTKFDSSVDRGQPFEFPIGAGHHSRPGQGLFPPSPWVSCEGDRPGWDLCQGPAGGSHNPAGQR